MTPTEFQNLLRDARCFLTHLEANVTASRMVARDMDAAGFDGARGDWLESVIESLEAAEKVVAAAPELLQACKMVIAAAQDDPTCSDSALVGAIDFDMILAAIAKAEGGAA